MISLRRFTIFFCLLIIAISISCKNHYNDMVAWSREIKIGTDIQIVKKNQPDWIEIDWDHPDTIDSFTVYLITKIKGNRDILHMENRFAFVKDKYQGRWANK